jgi:hypothetical protein
VTDSGVKLNWWEAINKIVYLLENENTLQRLRERCGDYARELCSPARFAEMLESMLSEYTRVNRNGSERLILTAFADQYWHECLPNELSPPVFQRGKKSVELYKELITPFTGRTESAIPAFEEIRPDQFLVLAVPVQIESGKLALDDPIFPFELAIPEAGQAQCKAVLEVMREEPVIEVKRLQKLVAPLMEDAFHATLKWMLEKGILLRTKPMEAYLDPDMIGKNMGKPVFSIQSVNSATDVIWIR